MTATTAFAWTALALACCALIVSVAAVVTIIRGDRRIRAHARRATETVNRAKSRDARDQAAS